MDKVQTHLISLIFESTWYFQSIFAATGTVRCGEHSDYGTITLLFQVKDEC